MSNDCSGWPGISTAVRHLVWVVVGAPGPLQGARAAPVVTSIILPSRTRVRTAASTVAFENRLDLGILFSFTWSQANTGDDFRVMTRPSYAERRPLPAPRPSHLTRRLVRYAPRRSGQQCFRLRCISER